MATVLLSRILGVLRDAIISHYFGRGPLTDAYNAAFTVPDLLFYLLQSGALSSTIVPIITEYRQQGDQRSADHTVSIVASTIFVVIGILICVMYVHARTLTLWLNPGFDPHGHVGKLPIATRYFILSKAVPLTQILLPAQIFFFIGGLMMGVLYSRKEFWIPALGPVIYNSGIIFGGIVLRRWLGIEGLVWGAVGGAFIGNFLIPTVRVIQLGVRLRPSLAVFHPSAVKVWKMLLPMGLGIALPNIDQMVNKLYASYLGAGETTAIMNAYRLMLLPIGIFAQAMALAVYPTLSAQAAEKNIRAMRSTMNASLRNIIFMTLPASVLMYVLAAPIITFLLESGKYSHADTLVTAGVLKSLSIGICAWSAQSLLTRGFYALQNSRIPVASGAIVSVLFVGMNWVVVFHTHLSVVGLGYATTLAATIHATALLILLRIRLRGINGMTLFVSVGETAIATICMGIFVCLASAGMQTVLPHHLAPKLSAIVVILVSTAVGGAVFFKAASMLRMPELKDALSLVRRRSLRA